MQSSTFMPTVVVEGSSSRRRTAFERCWRVEIAGPGRFVDAHYSRSIPLLFDLEQQLSNLRSRQVSLQLVLPPPPLITAPTTPPMYRSPADSMHPRRRSSPKVRKCSPDWLSARGRRPSRPGRVREVVEPPWRVCSSSWAITRSMIPRLSHCPRDRGHRPYGTYIQTIVSEHDFVDSLPILVGWPTETASPWRR